jgi:membrane fusion protein (multidrug efflux system)
VIITEIEPSRGSPLYVGRGEAVAGGDPMNDPYPFSGHDRTTWLSDAERQSKPPPHWKRWLGLVAGVGIAAVLLGAGISYWLHARHFETTDDAFIDVYVTQMAPQVAGRIIALEFSDNAHVTAGRPLVLIDQRDYRAKVDQAKAQQGNAVAGLEEAKAQLVVEQANVDQSRANVAVAEAELVQARKDYDRFPSIDPHAVSRQQVDVDSATAALHSSQAQLDAASQAVNGAEAQIQIGRAQVVASDSQVRQAEANLASAELQLSFCTVIARSAGASGIAASVSATMSILASRCLPSSRMIGG